MRWIAGLALVVVASLAAGLALRASGVRPVRITSGSMLPTIGVDEWVLITDASTASRGDIVEFRYPPGSTGRAIKRVAAVGGDVVELSGDALIVNGDRIALDGESMPFEPTTITVPEGWYYLLGDNHSGSIDSRSFGPIAPSDVVGRVRTTIPNPQLLVFGAAGLGLTLLVGPGAVRRRRRAPDPIPNRRRL